MPNGTGDTAAIVKRLSLNCLLGKWKMQLWQQQQSRQRLQFCFHSTWLRVFQISSGRSKCFKFMIRCKSRVFIICAVPDPLPLALFFSHCNVLSAFFSPSWRCLCPSKSSVKMMFIKLTPKDNWIGCTMLRFPLPSLFACLFPLCQGCTKVKLKPEKSRCL